MTTSLCTQVAIPVSYKVTNDGALERSLQSVVNGNDPMLWVKFQRDRTVFVNFCFGTPELEVQRLLKRFSQKTKTQLGA